MLIGMTGQKGSGKDTFAEALGFVTTKMADTLKNMLRTLYRDAGVDPETIERKIEGDLKEEPCEILGGATPRWAMQSLGTEWAKMVDPTHTLWSRIWHSKASALIEAGHDIVVTDVRFQHEAEALRDLSGLLVRIDRPGSENVDTHESETEMRGLVPDATVVNDRGIEELQVTAINLIKEFQSTVDTSEFQRRLISITDDFIEDCVEAKNEMADHLVELVKEAENSPEPLDELELAMIAGVVFAQMQVRLEEVMAR